MLDQIFGYILFAILAIILFIISIFMEISAFIGSFEKIPERVCDIKGESTVKLGEHKFRISSALRGAYISGNGRLIGNIKDRHRPYTKICPTGSEIEFVRNQFSIFTPPRSELTDTHLPFAANVTVSFGKNTAPLTDLFEGQKISETLDWEASGDFRTSIQGRMGPAGWSSSIRLFVTKDEKFVTPRGNLVAFQCPVGGRKNNRFKGCITWFAWSEDLLVSYSFSDQEYRIEEWGTLHG